jgi:putative methionine-R-sulfoxide reductase with GAF domain
MSSEGMDSNPEILDREAGATAIDEGAREWPGVSRESASPGVKFPGEDGGRSLAKMAERDLDAALQLLAERAQYITGATGAAIALRDGEEMVCRASAGGSAPEIGARLQMDSGLSGESIRTRLMLRCDDAQTDDRVNKESCEALGIASVIVMPMVDGGEVLGVFELFSDRAYSFEERDIAALERMGAMVRTAIEQVENGARGNGGSQATIDQTAVIAAAEPEADPAVEIAEPVVANSAVASGDSTSTFEDPAAPSLVMQAKEEIEEPVACPTVAPDVAEVAMPEIAKDATHDPEVATPVIAELPADRVDDSLFLSVAGKVENAAPEKVAEKVGTAESDDQADIGEMARDAAARTAAFKASLFAQETPAPPKPQPERVAFHMRVPAKKIEPRPIEEEIPATLAGAAENPKTEWTTPVMEEQEAVAEPAGVASSEEIAVAPAERATGAVTSGGAAVAPAREEPVKTTAPAIKVEEAPSAPASAWPVKPEQTELIKAKGEVARPASAEGRSRIAVSQVRKCEACGFPVSEGRKLCLDCEKHKSRDEAGTKTAPSTPATVTTAAASTKAETVVTNAPAERKADAAASVVPEPTARPEIDAKVEIPVAAVVEQKLVEPESKKSTAAPAAGKSVAEPPAPQFMVSAPDHYESWIVSHMYTAVAIAVVAVGIVVYLLSR